LKVLREVCDKQGALLIFDEIYTGFARTGKWFACEHGNVIPDVICLGKALTGGFPLSACVGKASVIDKAWPPSNGEAMHTSTFLGHPVGCAMALAELLEIERLGLEKRSAELGEFLHAELNAALKKISNLSVEIRGMGLMVGIELRHKDGSPATDLVLKTVNQMLQQGFLLLPEGELGNIISLTPPLIITKTELRRAVKALAEVLSNQTSLHA
jgi:4-aminobutyrate aminotransferase-like enzyme